jgi:hypothetical protein
MPVVIVILDVVERHEASPPALGPVTPRVHPLIRYHAVPHARST